MTGYAAALRGFDIVGLKADGVKYTVENLHGQEDRIINESRNANFDATRNAKIAAFMDHVDKYFAENDGH